MVVRFSVVSKKYQLLVFVNYFFVADTHVLVLHVSFPIGQVFNGTRCHVVELDSHMALSLNRVFNTDNPPICALIA